MAVEKVTPMILKADLQCPCCYKKIKKTLCKFPQIRDQVYNEKTNTVAITVVCCSPEKIRDKLCSKAGKAIKSIEIVEPEKKKEAEKPKQPAEKPKEKPKEADQKPKEKPKEPEKPKEKPKEADKPKADGKADKPKADGAPPAAKPKEAPKAEPPKNQEPAAKPVQIKAPEPVPVNGVPSVFPYIGPSYDAYSAGPYYHGYGFPPPPPQPCYEGYYGHAHGPHGYAYGYGGVAHVNKCDSYFSEENPQACTIM